MPRQTEVVRDKSVPWRKIRGKAVSAQEARNDLRRKRESEREKKTKTLVEAHLRTAAKESVSSTHDHTVSHREAMRNRLANTPFARLDFSSLTLAESEKNNNDNNNNNKLSAQSTVQEATATWFTLYDTGKGDNKCSDEPLFAAFVLANRCLRAATSSDSFMYSGDQYQMINTIYNNNTDCTGTDTTVYTAPLGCVDGVHYAFRTDPIDSNPLPPIGDYATEAYFGGGGCDGQMVGGFGQLNGACLVTSDTSSTKIDFPSFFYHNTMDCSDAPIANVTEPLTCEISEDEEFQHAYVQFKLLSGPPYLPETDPEGYLVLSYSEGEECSEAPQQIMGFALDTCQVDSNLHTSYKFSCSNEYAYKIAYQSGDCDLNTQTSTERFTLGCTSETDNSESYAVHALCSKGSALVFPGDAKYGVNKYFDVDNCAGHPLSYYGYVDGQCVSAADETWSYKLDYPHFYEYPSAHCEGNGTIFDTLANSTCQSLLHSYTDDYYYSDSFPDGLFVTGSAVQGHAISSDSSSAAVLDSTGIAGVVVGGLIGCALLAGGALFYAIHRNKNKSEEELQLSEQM